jgi:hypothetical protein
MEVVQMKKPESPSLPALPRSRAALITAHPSHELKVHCWIEQAKPLAFVLADGTAYTGRNASMAATDRVLRDAGAEPGCVYGDFPERAAYAALLRRDWRFFIDLAGEIAASLAREQVEYVVGDAAEGSILIHDVCRLVIDAAVEQARQLSGRHIASYDFLVEGPPDGCPAAIRNQALWVRLQPADLERKAAAARRFAAAINVQADLNLYLGKSRVSPDVIAPPEIRLRLGPEAMQKKKEAAVIYRRFAVTLDEAINTENLDVYRTECLRPVQPFELAARPHREKPVWEAYGEKLVAAGFYREAIRLEEHVLPLAEALQEHCTARVHAAAE